MERIRRDGGIGPRKPLFEPGASRAAGPASGPRTIDLLVDAIAEVNDAILLHYDRHFDLIADTTGQPVEWLARRGSLDRP
jgi:predicted nucleic acid-binding protein